MLRRLTFLLLLVFARWQGDLAAAPGTSPSVDSLRQLLATAPRDTNRLHLIDNLCLALGPDMAPQLPLAKQGLQLARQLHHHRYEAYFQSQLGTLALNQQDYITATEHFQKLLQFAEKPPVLKNMMVRAHLGFGDIAGAQDDFIGACKHFRLAVKWGHLIAKENSSRLNLLGIAYNALVRAYAFRLQSPSGQQGPPPDSLTRQTHYYIEQSQAIARQIRATGNEKYYRGTMASSWESLADLFRAEGKLDSAIFYKRRAIAFFTSINAPQQVLTQQQHLINLEIDAGHYPQAVALARDTRLLARQLGQPVIEADCMSSLATALGKQGAWKEAYQAMERSLTLRDTALSLSTRQTVAELQVRFDTERKEARIRELTQQRKLQRVEADRRQQQLWALGAVLVTVLIGAGIGVRLLVRLRRSRAQLAAMGASKDRLYTLVAHDLREPVHALDSVGGLIAYYLRAHDEAALAQLPALVTQAVGSVNQLLDNLLHWAASQSGELTCAPILQPAQALLDECAALWASTAQANQITLRVEPAPAGLLLWADPQMARTVLRNFAGNALKFTPNGGTVTLTAEAASGGVALRVTDTGPGISPDVATHLLGPSAPPPDLLRPGVRGEKSTGLGLRICLLFMQRHHGNMTFDSAGGTGTIARAWFPGPSA